MPTIPPPKKSKPLTVPEVVEIVARVADRFGMNESSLVDHPELLKKYGITEVTNGIASQAHALNRERTIALLDRYRPRTITYTEPS